MGELGDKAMVIVEGEGVKLLRTAQMSSVNQGQTLAWYTWCKSCDGDTLWVKVVTVDLFIVVQVLAMSSRTWLSYTYQSRFHLTPLSYETLEYASGFASEQCPEGIVAISTNTLRFVLYAAFCKWGCTGNVRANLKKGTSQFEQQRLWPG